MKLVKSVKKLLPLLAAVFLALALWAGISPPISASAKTAFAGAYDYAVTKYDVKMNVSETCAVTVTETISVKLLGYDSHGIIRDLPLGHNVRYRDISASCDYEDFEYYAQKDDSEFLSIYLRSSARAQVGDQRVYTLNYTMLLPAVKDGYLPLDVVGYGMQAALQNVTATVTLPAEPINCRIYSGAYGTQGNDCGVIGQRDGNVIKLSATALGYQYDAWGEGSGFAGITLDLQFGEGVLKSGFDFSVIYALLIAAALLAAAVFVKLFVCRNPLMTATVNFTAPDEMDSLKMGKFIDNSVDNEDIGAMVFWFAEQGYLQIDLTENDEDPTLIRTAKSLPEDAPSYQRVMLEGLFKQGTCVRASELENKFYKTANEATQLVNGYSKGFYEKKSKAFVGIFAVLTAVLLGGFAFLYPLMTVISSYMYWYLFAGCAALFVVGTLGSVPAAHSEFKWNAFKKWAFRFMGVAAGMILGLFAFLLPNPAFGYATGYILLVASSIAGTIAGAFLCRTKAYSDTLGQIVGFKNFITVTEKDKIEVMLQENPELYYHILPYAQVLGVSRVWEDKFEGLTMKPPAYMKYSVTDSVFNFIVWNSMFRSLNRNLARSMTSRPSSSGNGRISRGGFGGGFGGGGFGGGGMRGC